MPDNFYGGLDFGTSGARISIINLHKELVYSNSVPYSYRFQNPNAWIHSCEDLLVSLPIEIKINLNKLAKRFSQELIQEFGFLKLYE